MIQVRDRDDPGDEPPHRGFRVIDGMSSISSVRYHYKFPNGRGAYSWVEGEFGQLLS